MRISTLAFFAVLASALSACANRPDPAPAPWGEAGPRRVAFACEGGVPIAITFAGETATLQAQGRTVQLARQVVASGMHYVGGGHTLRGKGMEMTWTDPAGGRRQCRAQEGSAQQPQVQPVRRELAGSSWQLVHFESSDGRIGTKVPPNAERYRITFGTDGTLALRLDCNRATGRWEAGPSSASGGALTLTGGAMTRAHCGPGALDTQIARDLVHIRSYRFVGDRLSLALQADGGLYLWEAAAGE